MRYPVLFVVLLLAAVAAAGEPPREQAAASLDADGWQRLEVVAGSYYFQPHHLVVRSSVPVELRLRRETALVPHNFVLKIEADRIDIDEAIAAGGSVVRFFPVTPGRYPFYCNRQLLFFPSHRKHGMEGVLEVVP